MHGRKQLQWENRRGSEEWLWKGIQEETADVKGHMTIDCYLQTESKVPVLKKTTKLNKYGVNKSVSI